MKRQATDGKNIFKAYFWKKKKKNLYWKNMKNSQNAIVKKTNNTIKYGEKCFEQKLPQIKYMCNKLAYGKNLSIVSY